MFMTVDRVDEGMILAFFFFWGRVAQIAKGKVFGRRCGRDNGRRNEGKTELTAGAQLFFFLPCFEGTVVTSQRKMYEVRRKEKGLE
jgi:hypothetical protein